MRDRSYDPFILVGSKGLEFWIARDVKKLGLYPVGKLRIGNEGTRRVPDHGPRVNFPGMSCTKQGGTGEVRQHPNLLPRRGISLEVDLGPSI